MLRACLYLLFFVPWTLFCTLFAIISTYVDPSGRSCHRIALLWSRGCLFAAGVNVVVEGGEHLPDDRPVVLMGNHQSYFDVPALFQATALNFSWLAKEELFRVPVFGHCLRASGYIPVNRGHGRDSLKSLKRASALIRDGRSVAIFPEGTLTPDGALLPFKRGGFVLAEEAGVPIAPFSISGAREINPRGKLLSLTPGTIKIRFSPIIEADKSNARHPGRLMEQVREAIASRME